MENFSNLPSRWIKLDLNGKIIDKFCRRGMPEGYQYWILANAHYREGGNGEEYLTSKLRYLKEALLVREDPDAAGLEQICKRWVYGVRVPLTGEVKKQELGDIETYDQIMV